MNPENERYYREKGVNLQPPEYEPPLDPKYYGRPRVSTPFWYVVAATLAVVGVAALAIWLLT